MQCQVGMWIRNVKLPEWGIGEVVETDGDKVRVVFAVVGEKNLNVRFATLEEMPCPADASSARFKINVRQSVDVAEVERLCRKFHDEFKDRRGNTDDGGMSLQVLNDIQERGDLTRATAKRLFHWCHTGESYTQGVDLAQQICRVIYGRIPTRKELEANGFL